MDLGSGWFIFIGIGGLGPGLLIGTTAAFGYQRLAWKLNLPSWKEYGSR
jgi:hypothetical protein